MGMTLYGPHIPPLKLTLWADLCDQDFVTEFPFGDDVICPHCNRVWHTDDEYDYDNCYSWITSEADPQTDP